MLPYVEEGELFKEFKLDEPWDSEHNKKLLARMPKVYAIPGVTKVSIADSHERLVGYEIESEPNRDVRRDVARTVVDKGWGLLELRPMRMSLEEIFLQVTTDEKTAEAQSEPANDQPSTVGGAAQ